MKFKNHIFILFFLLCFSLLLGAEPSPAVHDYNYCPYCGYPVNDFEEFCKKCHERIIYYDRNELVYNIINKQRNREYEECQNNHLIMLGAKCYNYDYKEDLPPGRKSTELGWLPGIFILLNVNTISIIHNRFLVEFTDAKTKYDGTTQSGSPVKDNTRNNFLTLETDIEFNIELTSSFILTPYIGIGYRYWYRGGSEKPDYAPYSEDYSWYYVPIGIKPIIKIGKNVIWDFDIVVKIMFNGKIRVNMTDTHPLYNSPKADLGNKPGFKIGTSLNFKMARDIIFVLNPYYEYSAIKKSNTFIITYNSNPYAYGYEPSSTTYQYGLDLGIGYQF